MERTRDPVRTSRYAANALLVMVAALIAIAVGNEMVIAHPYEHSTVAVGLLLFGGPILFLLAEGWYLWTVPRVSPRLRVLGTVALVVVGSVSLLLPRYVALIAVATSLVVLAILD